MPHAAEENTFHIYVSIRKHVPFQAKKFGDALTCYLAHTRQVLDACEEQQLTSQEAQAPASGLSFKSDVYSFAIIAWEVLSLQVRINKFLYL